MLSHLVSYRVQLPVFSGPMDLLLHLVRRQEVSIHEVSIARILDDYLRHLEVLRELDLQDIGEFIVMASTLMEIKSRELLPNEQVEIEDELDPRDDLIRRLLEYKRYRDLARELDARAISRSRQSSLAVSVPRQVRDQEDEDLLDVGDIQVWDLTAAFARLLEEIGQEATIEVEVEKRDVAYYTERLLTRFTRQREVEFAQLFEPSEGRYGMIGTLISILEMMKQGYLTAHQGECFGSIQLVYQGAEGVSVDNVLAGISTVDEEGAAEEGAQTEQATPMANDGAGTAEAHSENGDAQDPGPDSASSESASSESAVSDGAASDGSAADGAAADSGSTANGSGGDGMATQAEAEGSA
ncbi:MAG: segregation/condensation protein A [Planctomycetota bacterium]|nr:segregation/condensation protein A [Planctomycetota bacterium]